MTRRFVTMAAAVLALLALAACSSTKKEDKPMELVKINARFTPKEVWTIGLGMASRNCCWDWRRRSTAIGCTPRTPRATSWRWNSPAARRSGVGASRCRSPGEPGAGSGLVLVCGTNGTLVALSEKDGSDRWHVQLSSEVLAAPAVSGDLVVVRTVDGKLFGLAVADGKQRWVADQQVPRLTLRGTSRPVIAGELAISGFDNGRLMAVTVATGNTAWDIAVGQPRGSSELQRLIDIDSRRSSTATTCSRWPSRVARCAWRATPGSRSGRTRFPATAAWLPTGWASTSRPQAAK